MAIVAKKRAAKTSSGSSSTVERGVWSADEHDKFLVALKMFPDGPWKSIAEQVGTRSARQVQTHAQKYYEKVARRLRGLRKDRKKLVRPEHRLGDDMVSLCKAAASDAGAPALGAPVRRGLHPVCVPSAPAPAAVGSPAGVDVPMDNAHFGARERADSIDSIDSLLQDQDDDGSSEMELSDATDSAADDSDSLLDFDGYYLDYLIELLGTSDSVVVDCEIAL